jgi:flagellar export protein FliJ
MKTFLFRLERILQLRSRAERERAQSLGHALRDEEARRRNLEEAAARLGRLGEQIADAAPAVANAGTLRNLELTVQAAASQVEAAEDSHRVAADVLEAEQERFNQARKERRVLERLREQRLAAWSAQAVREEQGEHDAIAQQRHASGGDKP